MQAPRDAPLPRTDTDPFAHFAAGEQLLADLALVLSHVDGRRLHPSLEPTPLELTLALAAIVMFDRGPLRGTEDYE